MGTNPTLSVYILLSILSHHQHIYHTNFLLNLFCNRRSTIWGPIGGTRLGDHVLFRFGAVNQLAALVAFAWKGDKEIYPQDYRKGSIIFLLLWPSCRAIFESWAVNNTCCLLLLMLRLPLGRLCTFTSWCATDAKRCGILKIGRAHV